jgi:DnaJ-domain-containing protein 1
MKGQFQVDRGYGATTPEGYEAVAAAEPQRRGWQFVDEFQRLLGEDAEPDVRFFVESWTSSTAAAVGSFQQRRLAEDMKDVYRRSDGVGSLAYFPDKAYRAEISDVAIAAMYAGISEKDRRAQESEEQVEQTLEEAWQDWERAAGESGGGYGTIRPMTQQLACRLLGVTEVSTRRQIKVAYRKLVSRWHPDRLELEGEKMRKLANERMAAINEAYHLLLDGLR